MPTSSPRSNKCATSSRTTWATPSTSKTDAPSPGIDWEVTIDRVAAAKYGIGVRELSPYVQLVTGGVAPRLLPSRRCRLTNSTSVFVCRWKSARFDALDSLRIVTAQGLVPVSNFIERKAVPKVANMSRRNGIYSMNVAANLAATNVPADHEDRARQDMGRRAGRLRRHSDDDESRVRRCRRAGRRHQCLHCDGVRHGDVPGSS